MTIETKITCYLIALSAGAWGLHHRGYTAGYAQRQMEYQAADDAAQRAARATEARQAENFLGAINARTQTTSINHAAAVATHTKRERVHDAFAARAALSAGVPTASADACANDRAAERELLASIGQAVDELTAVAERIAADADGHAADSLMYQQIRGVAPSFVFRETTYEIVK